MKLTDEAVEAVWRSWNGMHVGTAHDRLRAAIAAALPHLTDDGAADTPPADLTGVGAPSAAESATSTAAPSSPHTKCSDRCKLDAIEKLAEEWRYKGEFGWGPWQMGEGPGPEDQILDDAAGELRNILNGTCDS